MIFLLLGAAAIFAKFLSVTGVVATATKAVIGFGLPFWGLMAGSIVLYLLLGCFLDAISMMLLTMPFVAPLITAHGQSLGLVWRLRQHDDRDRRGHATARAELLRHEGGHGRRGQLNEIFAGAAPFVVLMLLIAVRWPRFPACLPVAAGHDGGAR